MAAVRFVMAGEAATVAQALAEIGDAQRTLAAITIEPQIEPSYDALERALAAGDCVGWAPPLVASNLITDKAGAPLVAVGRRGLTSYYAAFVVRRDARYEKLADLASTTVGWVSTLSAAWYVVPRLHLRSLGIEPDALFAKQLLLGSHARVREALAAGTIDVGATHAALRVRTGELELAAGAGDARVLAAVGPIPGDVIFAGRRVPLRVRESMRGAFLAMHVRPEGALAALMKVERFEVPTLGHYEILREWRAA
jgi:ABC-type phosphate/phosphonate transport system substrate-binding protein